MGEYLPRLRSTLELLPSPAPDRPGMVLRDPLRYSEDILLIPSAWVVALSCLDGSHTELDLQALLVRQGGGRLIFSHEVQGFVSLLRNRGFLETEEFRALQQRRHADFRASRQRLPAHAGGAYPADPAHLREIFDMHLSSEEGRDQGTRDTTISLAAPHVSLEGGWDCYTAAYQRIDSSWADKTFIILATSHYGRPDTFGLTRKAFVTPLGTAEVDEAAVDFLAQSAPESVAVEDYCHAVEHSVEFQVVFLQYRVDAPVKILPILCGPFMESVRSGRFPEESESLKPFFDALTELANRRAGSLLWLLGIDLAHIGRRYGDPFGVRAGHGPMTEVESRDRERLARVCEIDPRGLLELVTETDPLKWCGFTPLYTFLTTVRPLTPLEGRVLKYEQWNIDPQSVVTFAGLEFRRSGEKDQTLSGKASA